MGDVLTPEQRAKMEAAEAAEKEGYARQKLRAKEGKVKTMMDYKQEASPTPPQSEYKGLAPTVTDQINVMQRKHEKLKTDDGKGN